jgi:(p)ppGpp synthase/HD superfamily hydrolase
MELLEHELVKKAHAFAAMAHAGVVRKWSGEPYVEHCERVAGSLAALGFGPEVVAAGFLHDVVEDTHIGPEVLAAEFSPKVAALVVEVTNPKIPKEPGNRAARKAAVVNHLAGASYEGASIKLADMADNSSNVAEHDPEFAKGYLAEMAKKVAVLSHGHPELLAKVKANLENSPL